MKYALTKGKIYTCNKNEDIIEKGTILIKDGKIWSILLDNEPIPEGYEIINTEGKCLAPGFIDSHTHQGLMDATVGKMGVDINEMTNPTTPMMRALDALNSEDPALTEAVIGGVTTIHTGPGSGNVIGGECLILKTYSKSKIVDDLIIKQPSALKAALGENPKRVYGSDKKMPSTRMGIAALFRKAFIEAENYDKKWKDYEIKKKFAEENGTMDKIPQEPERDLTKETLVKVLQKEIPINIHCHQHNDIVTAIRLAEEFKIDLMLIHATESHKIAEYIAEKKIPVSIGPSLVGMEKPELKEISFKTPSVLWKAGVKFSIHSDTFPRLKYFQLLPCMAVKEGLPINEALKAVTINAAEMLGISERVGSIEKGKDADIVVWSNHPIEDFYAEILFTFVNGEIAYQKSTTI